MALTVSLIPEPGVRRGFWGRFDGFVFPGGSVLRSEGTPRPRRLRICKEKREAAAQPRIPGPARPRVFI